MTRSLARSLFLFGAGSLAVGCAPQSGQSEPISTGGPVTEGQGTGGLCGGGFSMIGGVGFATTGSAGGFGAPTTPQVGVTHTADVAPPAISGGTLRIMPDGVTAIAADPDRDQVYVVDLAKRSLSFTVALQKGDEPGRVTVDGAGRAQVALRHGGALVTIDPASGSILARRDVCAAPRGLAYDATNDLVHVACADGQLVSVQADPTGTVTRTVQLDSDLRDVIVQNGELHVTRFRSAELLTLDPTGAVQSRTTPPPFRAAQTRNNPLYTPSVAWRSMELPSGGVVMLHQRGLVDDVMPTAGGYGSSGGLGNGQCDAIVQTAVTIVQPGKDPQTGPAMAGMVVPADMAVSADGSRVAIIAAGNATNSESADGPPRMPRVFVTDMSDATDQVIGCASDGQHGPCLPSNGFVAPPDPTGQSNGTAVSNTCGTSTDSGSSSDPDRSRGRRPAHRRVFHGHGQRGRAVARARRAFGPGWPSHHAVDGEPLRHGPRPLPRQRRRLDRLRVLSRRGHGGRPQWTFACEGTRRTQSLQVGLAGTEPFHWGGDERDFPTLVQDVFVGRMSGPNLDTNQISATLHWIDAQPRRARSAPTDLAAVSRGSAIFHDGSHAACGTCHVGPSLTNSQTVDVGTGGKFQVPSLVGIGTRGPYMHDGCALTLKDRFGPCGGGDKHGVTSKLSSGQVDDLIAYLDTL